MITLNRVALMVALFLAVQASDGSTESDGCLTKFPDGFFCSLICQQWDILKGTTVMCFINDDEHYHTLIGRNPEHGVWRFYKVNETSDMNSLCKASVNGDLFYLKATESVSKPPKLQTSSRQPYENTETDDKSDTDVTDDVDDTDETISGEEAEDPIPESKNRASVNVLIDAINQEISKIFDTKMTITEKPREETANGVNPSCLVGRLSSRRHFLARFASPEVTPNNDPPLVTDICHLVTMDLCRNRKMITCPENGDCCWANIDYEACKPDNLLQHDECYKGLRPIMSGIQYQP